MELRLVVKCFFYAIFTVVCLAQCFAIIWDFLKYPMVIDMFDLSPSLISVLPGVTICNNNRVSLKKLAKRNRAVKFALEEKFPNWFRDRNSFVDRAEFMNFRDEVTRAFERINYQPQEEMDNATMNEMFTIKPDSKPFINWIGCARTWTDSIECGLLSQIDSVQDRRCTTILHRGAMHHDVYNRPFLFNSTRASAGTYSYFDAKEVIKILLDFEPEDYADLKRQIGSRVIFHDSNHVGSQTELDFYVTRGYKYDFSIDRKSIKLTQDPKIECFDYDGFLDSYKTKIDPRQELDIQTCIQNCMIDNVVNYKNCWPPSVPYFRNDTLDPGLKMKACSWFKPVQQLPVAKPSGQLVDQEFIPSNGSSIPVRVKIDEDSLSRVRMRVYRKMRRYCMSKCVLGCEFSSYKVSVTRSAWPTDVQILFDKTGQERLKRHCCALVTIKYAHFHHTVHESNFKYDWANTLGNLGGLLAVWLGVSIISVYKGIQRLVGLCSGYLATTTSSNRVHVEYITH